MTSRRIRAARALSGEAPAAPAELTGVLCFGAHGPPAWLSALTGSWSPGPSTRLTCRGSPMAPGRPPRPRPHKPPRTRSLPPCGKLQIGKAPSGSPPFPTAASAPLCSQTPPSDRTASSRARLSACRPEPRRAEGWPWPLGGPGESWMRGSLLAASPVSADGGGAAKSIHFVLHDGRILPKAHIP